MNADQLTKECNRQYCRPYYASSLTNTVTTNIHSINRGMAKWNLFRWLLYCVIEFSSFGAAIPFDRIVVMAIFLSSFIFFFPFTCRSPNSVLTSSQCISFVRFKILLINVFVRILINSFSNASSNVIIKENSWLMSHASSDLLVESCVRWVSSRFEMNIAHNRF